MDTPDRMPIKVIIALTNLGFIALAFFFKQDPTFTYLAIGVWGMHATMALLTTFIAPKRGLPASKAIEVLFVGTFALMLVLRTPKVSA